MWHSQCTYKQKRRHFHAKTTCAKLYIYIGSGPRDLFIDEAHTALGIFSVFFPLHAAYSALRHFCSMISLCVKRYFHAGRIYGAKSSFRVKKSFCAKCSHITKCIFSANWSFSAKSSKQLFFM